MVISKGEIELFGILKSIFPGHKIIQQFHIGERLRLDFFIPHMNMGIEYQGSGHFEESSLFDQTKSLAARQYDDDRKRYLCKKLGIALIEFDYKQKLSYEIVQMSINYTPLLEETEELRRLKNPTEDIDNNLKQYKDLQKEQQKKQRKELAAEFKKSQKYKDMKEMSKKVRKQIYKENKERQKELDDIKR